MLEKPKRIVNESLLDKFRKQRCHICNMKPCDPCHIKTVGSGGPDVEWNLLSLCRPHHTEQHALGFYRMCDKYPFLRQILAHKGWIFDGSKKLRRE